jgi:hypothetical protein
MLGWGHCPLACRRGHVFFGRVVISPCCFTYVSPSCCCASAWSHSCLFPVQQTWCSLSGVVKTLLVTTTTLITGAIFFFFFFFLRCVRACKEETDTLDSTSPPDD